MGTNVFLNNNSLVCYQSTLLHMLHVNNFILYRYHLKRYLHVIGHHFGQFSFTIGIQKTMDMPICITQYADNPTFRDVWLTSVI